MLRPYLDLLATPGARAFSAAGFVARTPMAMMSLGIVLLVERRTERYAVAGVLAAAYALVNATSSPLIARMVDRLGQRRVIRPMVALHAVCLLGFVAVVSAGAPIWTWAVTVAATGATGLPIGSMVRARWGHVLGADPRLQTAYSLESVLDELIFVLGPLVVTVLAIRVDDRAGLLASLAMVLLGTSLLVRLRGTEPPSIPRRHGGTSVLRAPGMVPLVLAMVFIGGVFGGVEISAVAFADERDRDGLAGPLLACYALGSMLAGLFYGSRHWRAPLPRRFLIGAAVMMATVSLLPFAARPEVLAPLLFLAGIGIAPTLIAGLSLIERIVAPGQLTEGLTWATTGLIVGLSLATSAAGQVVDKLGAQTAFAVGATSGAIAVLTCVLGYRRLGKAAGTFVSISTPSRADRPGAPA